MFSSLICGVDFSNHSIHALRFAVALAGHSHGRLTVVHVTDALLAQAARMTYDLALLERETHAELHALVEGLRREAGSWAPDVAVHLSAGDAAAEILRRGGEESADLVVVGTHGLSGYRKLLFGSVTERVLRRTTIPVLAVPSSDEHVTFAQQGPTFPFGSVLAPVDLGSQSLADARVALELAASFHVPLILVHVVPRITATERWLSALRAHESAAVSEAQQKLAELVAQLAAHGAIQTHVAIGSPADEIAAVASERHAGFVVMGLRGAGGMLSNPPGTTTYRVFSLLQVPVLALTTAERGA